MELLNSIGIHDKIVSYIIVAVLFALLIKVLFSMVRWGRKMTRGAFLFLAIFPLIAIFPIPPPVFKNVEKAKQEQRKRKEDNGDLANDEP